MIEALLGVALFSGIVLGLVGIVLVARARLLPEGVARILVNDRRQVEGRLGMRLLDALSGADLPLPSACGGKGTCGQCRVEVEGAALPVLPTERARLTRRELSAGVRLSCQQVLRGDVAVRIPDEIFGVRSLRCQVESTRHVGTLIREIVAMLPEGEHLDFRAGSFVQVTAPPNQTRYSELRVDPAVRDEWDRLDLWRYEAGSEVDTTRAYSLANHPGESDRVILLIRLAVPPPGAAPGTPAGIVSSWLFGRSPGDALDISGPYGHFFAEESDLEMVFIGGGAGMAPMRSIILDQLLVRRTTRPMSFWYGARSGRELFYTEEFDRLHGEHPNFRWTAAISDPGPGESWKGEVGFIHEVLHRRYLAGHPSPESCEYYVCGPPLMMRATASMLEGIGVPPEHVRFDDFGG